MIDSYFRSSYQRLIINPLLRWEKVHKISPHTITFLATLSGLLIPFCLHFHLSSIALVFLGLTGFFDTLDGSLARHLNISSSKGAALDIVSDRLVEFAIILALYLHAPKERGLLTLFMLGAILLCITTFLVVGIFEKNDSEKSFHYSPGLMERTEAFILFSLMILTPYLFTPLSLVFIILTSLTSYIRIHQFIKQ